MALVRLSDANAAIQAARNEAEAMRADARRWDFVRHHWSNAQMRWNNDATNSLKSIVLTIKVEHWSSGADDIEKQLDVAITAAMKGDAHV
ncbi:hypothetical protein SAMN03159371_05301 [Variovorax sp. NFACC28]|nr:hypothetical protein SAMN03159371_05301 [Variovorax sp. NFACC28]SEG89549.1 hypothetical protein SAMN03159365_05146 [Variovorax sp. NFACC29]SFD40917.1 hypothetical protein SAMN03159379_05191 [Variovorax sp. NFACC26]SFG43037.1 hypothetical protein SAMN03159447_03301 [Variovorax sp. NFACC27]